jgi:o-succinylbenzoate synthase
LYYTTIMKITDIKTTTLKAPLKTPFITALRRVDHLEDLVVIIECDNGLIGYGEGAPTPVITGETIGSMHAVIDFLRPYIIGKEIDDFELILNNIQTKILHNSTAKSALEIAMYDLKAKAEQLPLFKLLSGTKTSFKTDITISINPTEQMIRDAVKAVNLGYDTLKIKVGDDPLKDAERIVEIHRAIPDDITLRLDANQGWNAEETIHLLRNIEQKGIYAEFIEQPVPAHDIQGLKKIKQAVDTPVLADESVFSLLDAQKILEMRAADLINIKLAKCGGISHALKLADLCAEYEVKCMLGCMLEGPIAIAAALHVASAKADIITMLDLDGIALLASNPAQGCVIFDEYRLELGEEPGLGVRL